MYNQYYYKNKNLQKPKYVIMAAVAALFFAGVVTSGGHVRADDGWGAYASNGIYNENKTVVLADIHISLD